MSHRQSGAEAFFNALREITPPEDHNDINIAELSQDIDDGTMFYSGSFDRYEGYQKLAAYGEEALPALLTDVKEGFGNPWWRFQMVAEVAIASGLEETFRPNRSIKHIVPGMNAYQLDGMRSAMTRWGIEQGYIEGRRRDKVQIAARKLIGIA